MNIEREIVAASRDLQAARLMARSIGVSNDIRDFLKRMEAHFGSLEDARRRLERMQYEETGIGGRKEDKGITDAIERIDNNMDLLDEMIDFVGKTLKRMK